MSTIKFASLLIRTIAKPIANSIKSQAKSHPNFRKVCISLAQTGHRVEMNLKMRFFGYKQDHIRPLNDAKAIETGANFLSEAIIFSVAGSVILFENQRSRLAARDRKNLVDDTLAQLEQDNVALREEMQRQTTANERLETQVADLQTSVHLVREVLDKHLTKEIQNYHQDISHYTQQGDR